MKIFTFQHNLISPRLNAHIENYVQNISEQLLKASKIIYFSIPYVNILRYIVNKEYEKTTHQLNVGEIEFSFPGEQ